MAAYSRVYDSRHLQADCQEPGSAPKPYARQSNMGYLYLFHIRRDIVCRHDVINIQYAHRDLEGADCKK